MAVKMRAAGYARVSVAHEESTSIDQQIDAIAEKCKREGWLFDPKKDLYIDEGLSGSKKNVKRPQFEKMISSASKYDRIVVFRFDRLSRRMSELATTIETLNELHVAVVSINEGFGTDTDHGRTMANIMGSLAAGEAEAIRQRVKSTQARMFVDGKWKGGARPFGWTQEKKQGGGVRLILVKSEADILRKAVKMIIKGKTIGGTARELNAAGHRTYKGTPFSPQMLSNVLRSELLLGRHVVNKKLAYGSDGKPITPHEALIKLDEWVKLQAALGRLRVVRPKKGGALLAGVAYCSLCEGKMQGSSTESNEYANYRCRNKYALLNGKCVTGTSIRAVAIDELVSLAVIEVLKKKKNIQSAGKRIRQSHAEAVKLQKRLEDELEDSRRIHRGLREQYLSGGYNYPGGESDYRADLARASKNLTEASAAVDELDEVVEEPADLYPWTTLSAIDVKWAKATNEEKNKVIRALVDRIEVKPRSVAWKHRGLDPDRVEIIWRYAEPK
jgi:DNA invertase Pin-like site-specific DNA recombinase